MNPPTDSSSPRTSLPSNILNLAHRGAHGPAPENSLEAFESAMTGAADGVELDLHETSDGRFVVHHDGDIRGCRIGTCSYGDLPLPSGHPQPAPELGAALDLLASFGKTVVFAEVKGLRSWSRLRRLIDPYHEWLDLRIMSFDRRIINEAATDSGGFPLGIIARSTGPDPVGLLNHHHASLLSLYEKAVNHTLVDTLHRERRELHVWTVNNRLRMRELVSMNVDGLISDHPDIVATVLNPDHSSR